MKKLPLVVATALSVFTVHAVQADSAKLVNPANSHSYQRFDTAKTWLQAKNACANQGGYLATVTSKAENNWIVNNGLSSTDPNWGTWIGGADSTTEGVWTWITGEPFNYINGGFADNAWSGQDYLVIHKAGGWDDIGLPTTDYEFTYLCEWNSSAPVLKQSWQIPDVHYCSSGKGNLTSTTCFNNINGATIKVLEIGDKTRMNLLVNPTNQYGSFFFKMTFPAELRVTSLKIINSEPIPAQEGSEVADVLALVGGEALGKVLGKLNFPIQLITTLYPINSAGDPSFLTLLPPDAVLSKELYPYQTIERHFQRPSPSAAITVQVDSDVPYSKFKTVMDLQKISFYIGSNINNELLVDKLRSK